MSLARLEGQPEALATLTRALESRRVHHAYRFEGPDGVGKELAAFGLAMALVCTEGSALGCGTCNACRRATTLSDRPPPVPLHPDAVLVETGLYPEAIIGRDEKVGISVEQIRRIVLAQVGFTPAEGRARIFIVRRAEELTPQAANALLKTLEEPRPATHFVLLTSRPDRLLPTIRSRSVLVRFRPLPDEVLARVLASKGVDPTVVSDVVPVAEGSVEKALELAQPERAEARAAFLAATFEAARSGSAGAVVAYAEAFEGDRREARDRIQDLAAHLAARARSEPGSPSLVAYARGYEAAMAAADHIETANTSPAHVLTQLAFALHRAGVR